MGLLRRGERRFPKLTPLPPVSELPTPKLESPARYLGTLTETGVRVTGQSLAAQSSARLNLSAEALDVVRMGGSFRIPARTLRGAHTAAQFSGKPVQSLLVVRWEHGEQEWLTGFRLEAGKKVKGEAKPPDPAQWARTISKMSREQKKGEA